MPTKKGHSLCWIAFLGLTLVASCIAVFYLLKAIEDPVTAPPHPPTVPENALWIGGADGGVFVILQPIAESKGARYFANIYNDSTGEVWYKGPLELHPSPDPSLEIDKASAFGGWDGYALHLRDRRYLAIPDAKVEYQ